jgi:protein regulator of cytokinesis 1
MDTSYLAQQVNASIGQLHGLFDEIGVPNHEREAREEEVCIATRVSFLIGARI